MGFYSRHVLPRLIHVACSAEPNRRQREKIVPLAEGRVLEIGVGSGLNFPHYDRSRVSRLHGLEPEPQMVRMARRTAAELDLEVELFEAPAEEIPLDDGSIDTVVVTYTLCTIPEVATALAELRRVLVPGGSLLFCEHGAAPDASVRRWQDRVDPLWSRLAGGCHLNRPIPEIIVSAGFTLGDVETMYLPGWRPATFNFWGRARPR